MANWRKTKDELPKDNEQIIFMDCRCDYYMGYYESISRTFVQDVNDGIPYIADVDNVPNWCPIPEYDLD